MSLYFILSIFTRSPPLSGLDIMLTGFRCRRIQRAQYIDRCKNIAERPLQQNLVSKSYIRDQSIMTTISGLSTHGGYRYRPPWPQPHRETKMANCKQVLEEMELLADSKVSDSSSNEGESLQNPTHIIYPGCLPTSGFRLSIPYKCRIQGSTRVPTTSAR